VHAVKYLGRTQVLMKILRTFEWLFLIVAIAGCAGRPLDQILLMPAPDVYEEGKIDPFIDNDPIIHSGLPGVLYATDRTPAMEGDRTFTYYSDERANVLRLGVASVQLGVNEEITWEEARRISLLKNRTTSYPLKVTEIEEFGALARTVRPLDERIEPRPEPGDRFAREINKRLERSSPRHKDVFIYVHGYKVAFENPVLVASELWHFLGYQGAFVAYAWPSGTKRLAYFSDLDDAINSARSLRGLILHIAENTNARRIHIVGYSAGTQVVSRALADLGMYGYLLGDDEIDRRVKLGNVILVGSDVDRDILGGYLIDGALRIPDTLTIYQSSADSALGVAEFLLGRPRSGQTFGNSTPFGPRAIQFFKKSPNLRIVDVTDAEGGTSGNGHSYFRTSPWVSSDILMTLLYDLPPEQRGLILTGSEFPVWTFPPDYIDRLRKVLAETNPDLVAGGGSKNVED